MSDGLRILQIITTFEAVVGGACFFLLARGPWQTWRRTGALLALSHAVAFVGVAIMTLWLLFTDLSGNYAGPIYAGPLRLLVARGIIMVAGVAALLLQDRSSVSGKLK